MGLIDMSKFLITGATGFIGTALLQVLMQENVDVIAVVRTARDISRFEHFPNVRFVACDMHNYKDLPLLISEKDIDICIHLAWDGSTGKPRADYNLQLDNTRFTLDLVEALARMNVKRFIGAGTLAEKDVLQYHPNDGSVPDIVSTYGISKMTTHFMTKVLCINLGIEHVWCYLSNTYGVGNHTKNFINFACNLMLHGERASFTCAEQMYDFVYITDTAKALYLVSKKGKPNTAYYLGSTRPRILKEYINIIRDEIDPSIELHFGEIPFHGVPLPPEAYDCKSLIQDTGYVATVSFEEGIKQTVLWLRDEIIKKNW